MLELVLEMPPVQGYVGLTLAIPVFLTALIAVACGLLFVLGAALGITLESRAAYTLTIAPLVAFVVWGGQRVFGVLRRRWPLGTVLSLGQIAERDLSAQEVGAKARHLALLAARRLRVAPGWVIPASVFEAAGEGVDATPPRRTLRRLMVELEASGEPRFLIRSSFGAEDTHSAAAPGIYASVVWSRADGIEGLSRAIGEVWASWWSEQALAYRALDPERSSPPRLAILAQPLLAHDHAGVAASVDLVTGGRARHLIDATCWQGCHDWVRDRVTTIAGEPPLSEALIREISRVTAVA